MDLTEKQLELIKKKIIRIEGVVGIGVEKEEGSMRIVVMVREDDEKIRRAIKDAISYTNYRIEVTGEFKALKQLGSELHSR